MLWRLRSFWYGMTLPYRALRLILGSRGLLLLSILPIAITVLIYTYLIIAFQAKVRNALQSYVVSLGFGSESLFSWIISPGITLLFVLLSILTFAFLCSIVALPFNDFLAEKTERFATPSLPEVKDRSFLRSVRNIGIDLIKTSGSMALGLFALLLCWVPVVNILCVIVGVLMICFQYTSYPQTRRGIGFCEGLRFLKDHRFACAGFGTVLAFLFALPIVSWVVLPVAVVGGTLLVGRAPGSSSLRPLK